uniref:Eukaryotic translation initiation factor 4 gamma 2 n=1 Tax=Anopheles atroparvus TaxID=41427 RepID=A0A182J7M1_ANOAO
LQQHHLRRNGHQFSSFTIPGKIEKIAVPPSVGLRSAYPTAGASPTFKTEDPRQTGTESRATGRENQIPPASRRWVPPSLRPQHGLTEEARIDSIFRKVRGILNKLTPEKFQKLSDELLKLDLNSSKILNGVILLIFDKALDEPKYSSMYAQLCKRIEKELETDIDKNKSSTFLQILLNVCRDKFENRVQYSEKIINSESTLTDDLEEKKNVAKQKILGNVKFIGELYKLDMLAEPHLHKMLRSLFTNKSSSSTEKNCEDMECLAQLIRTCGKNLDTELGKQLMDQYFDRMEQYSLSSKFPPRIRFMLRDLIELRKNNWTPRKVALVEGPAPIQELNHDDDVLPPGLNHLRNRDRDYRNNDRSEQRDWISKFTLNLQHLNDGFNLLSVSSPSPLLPSYNQSSNGYGNRDHRDNGGGGSGGNGGGGNYRMHNNRGNQSSNYSNNMRYNKHNNNHHHHQGGGGGGGGGGGSGGNMRDGGSGSHISPYGNSNIANNKDLAPRFKRNLMTPPQNPVEELQMRPTPNSLLFKANMNIKTQLPISAPMGGGGGGKMNFNAQTLNEFASPLTTRTLLSEQRNAGQINSSAFSGGNNNSMGSGSTSFGVSGGSSGSSGTLSNPMGHQYHHEDSQQHHYTPQQEYRDGGHQRGHGGGMNGDRSMMGHDGPSHHNRHYDSQGYSLAASSTAFTTGPNTSISHGNTLTPKEQTIVKQVSSEKVEKRNKKDKGPSKDEYLVRVAAFVSDVMLENIKQQIGEEEQEQKKIAAEGNTDVASPATKGNDLPVQEVVVEVVDKKMEAVDIGSETNKDEDSVASDERMEENWQKSADALLPETQDTTSESTSDDPVPKDVAVEEEFRKPTLMEKLVLAFSDLKIPEKFMRDALIKILNEVLDRNDSFHAKTIEFLQVLRKETKLPNSAVLESFKSVVNGMSEKEKTIPKITTIMASLLTRAVAVNLCKLTDVSSYTDNGQHYPLFLLVLQHLHKQLGKPALLEMFKKSKVNLMASLPECDRTKERMAEILEDRNLSFLYPLLRVQAELWKQIQSDANPQHFYKWIKENVEATCYTDPGFITAVMTVLLKYISQESDKLAEDKKQIEKEKEIWTRYCPVLNAFLHSNIDLQLIAIYAIQVYWYGIGYPKGVLLRWFQEMYELSVIEEDAFLRYKEDVTDIYPGKGKALFQVNQWLTWLAEAEDEDDEEED